MPIIRTVQPGHDTAHRHRWAILAVLCVSVFVVIVDATIVNVALPSMAIELGASTRELQWIVDAYNLVFAGLLLAAGSLGDRYGRKGVLLIGLAVFAATSALAGSVETPGALIGARALMGIGAALIFPATLALLTSVFTDATERAKAIGIWAATSGIAVAAGPIAGGWLLEHFWWGSVFFINLPVVAVGLLAVAALVPQSRDRRTPRLDLGGLGFSTVGVGLLVLAIIEAPEWGWVSGETLAVFAGAAVSLGAFVAWELRVTHPMLPVRIFRNLRFSAASVSITAAFFALFGFIFLITQYFQLIRSYSPLEAGVRTIPVAVAIAIGSIVSPRLAERVGTTRVVAAGLVSMAIGFAWVSTASAVTPYGEIVAQMIFLGFGLGMTTAPATDSIMGSVDLDWAGVGSAVNDTTRELGGTLGVAVVGSVFASIYTDSLGGGAVFSTLPPTGQATVADSVGAAPFVADLLGPRGPALLAEVNDAFLAGLGTACLVAAGVALAGAVFAGRFLPARAAEPGHAASEGDGDGGPEPAPAVVAASGDAR